MPRLVWSVTLSVVIATASLSSQTPAPLPSSAQEYLFPSGAGLLVFHVRPDKTADFEAVVVRLLEVLDRATDPLRRAQASSWRIFRSVETPREAVLYVFFFDPAVSGADYDPIRLLGEAAPTEVHALYERLRADVVRVERMGLTKLR